jgi:hypothetical protein
VIDRSGSMAGRKLEVTKACAAFLARRLAPTDRIALVTYDEDVRMLTPLAEPTAELASAIAMRIGTGAAPAAAVLVGPHEPGRAIGIA